MKQHINTQLFELFGSSGVVGSRPANPTQCATAAYGWFQHLDEAAVARPWPGKREVA